MGFKRLQEQAYDHLREMVLAGEFEWDVVYSETKTAEGLGISRTPVREALQRLAHEGLIDIMPSKGFRLHKLTYDDIIENYQVRCAIEGYCVRLIALQHDTPEGVQIIDYLSKTVVEQRGLNENQRPIQEFVELDHRFHMAIIGYVKNGVFIQTYANQMYRMRMITAEAQIQESRRKNSLREHLELVDTIRNHDALAAYECIIHHYQNMIDRLDASRISSKDKFTFGTAQRCEGFYPKRSDFR